MLTRLFSSHPERPLAPARASSTDKASIRIVRDQSGGWAPF